MYYFELYTIHVFFLLRILLCVNSIANSSIIVFFCWKCSAIVLWTNRFLHIKDYFRALLVRQYSWASTQVLGPLYTLIQYPVTPTPVYYILVSPTVPNIASALC